MTRKMKDSGIEWIGEIPEEWEISKIKNLSNYIYTGNSIKDDEKDNYIEKKDAYPYISTKDIDVTYKTINYKTGIFIPKTDLKFKIADKDSTLLCIEGGSAGKKISFTNQKVAFVNKLCCFKSTNNSDRYIFYLLSSECLVKQFNLAMTGLIGGVSISNIKQFIMPHPPKIEQEKIANYLDNKCNKIDQTIEKEKAVIEKLKEYKQSVITEAVTKGLNPDAPMKDSGVEWIGEIPEHWKASRFSFETWVRARLGWKGLKADEYVDEGYIFLATPNIKSEEIDFENVNYINEFRYNESPEIKLSNGDVLLTKDGSTLGTVNVVRKLPKEATVNSSIAVITPGDNVFGIYLMYYIKSEYVQKIIENKKDGMGVPHLFQKDINKIKLLCPPIQEQKAIADYLDKKCSAIDKLISNKEKVIEKLTEYKKSLIYECVTGKREVQ